MLFVAAAMIFRVGRDTAKDVLKRSQLERLSNSVACATERGCAKVVSEDVRELR